jgi:restriction endonuclease S subunit
MKGTTLQRISLDFVGDYLIPLPPIEIQKNFVEELKKDERDKQNLKAFINNQKDKRERDLRNLWQKVGY